MARLTSLCLEGDFPAAREMQRRLHALMEINFIESNPGPVKAAMALMGLIEPVLRLPAVMPRPESIRKIEKVLLGLGLIPESPEAETSVEVRLAGCLRPTERGTGRSSRRSRSGSTRARSAPPSRTPPLPPAGG
jgi:hypothetical protein